ncbi:MAG: hypothetical protein LBK54_06590 [Propionibacteriaceae bacterium]|jgi:hypothetical protein|nr:hypothetical protein [Propionibacteriaceae bacterium]
MGTRRRIQALVAQGWDLSVLAGELGVTRKHLWRVVWGERSASDILIDDVAGVYDRLWGVDPVSCGVSRHQVATTRLWAAEAGWVGPLCWDDDEIDDPAAAPAGLSGGLDGPVEVVDPVVASAAALAESLLELLAAGVHPDVAAARCGYRQRESVIRRLRRAQERATGTTWLRLESAATQLRIIDR